MVSSSLAAKDIPLVIDNKNESFNPALHATFLSDPENNIHIEEILSGDYSKKFVSNTDETIHFGLVSSNYWVKFKTKNLLGTSPYLEIENPAIDTVEYYLVNKSGVLVHQQRIGNSVKMKDRVLQTSQLILDMNLSGKEVYTCFIKVKAHTYSIAIPMRITTLEKFYSSMRWEMIWHGLYFGLIVFLFIYNVFLFLSIKDSSYLYFALMIGFMGVMFTLLNGFGNDFLGDAPSFLRLIPLTGAAASAFMILFSARFLNSRTKAPKIHLWLLALIVLFVPLIILDLVGFHNLALRLILYNSIMGLIFIMFLATKAWNSGYKPAKFYLLAWSFYVIGVIICLLVDASIIDLGYSIISILQISSTISVLFISFALSKKINVYIDKRNEAQELVLKTALENERLISNQNQLLESKVVQRTIDLEQTISTLSKQRKDLHDANAFKDKVFSIISHDLKSPITSLAGLLQIMKMKTLNEEERSNAIDSLGIALKGTKNLLDNILAWANKKPNAVEEAEEIELNTLVEEIFQSFQFQASNKNITLENLIEKGFHILSNADMLRLVIRNLVSNALKFTPKNGSVKIGIRQEFPNVEIFVKDSGIGMSKEVCANLFKSNMHNSTRGTENEKGTGLGLMLCKEFVDKYDGSIHVKSELKKGTTFTLTIKNAIPVLETVLS